MSNVIVKDNETLDSALRRFNVKRNLKLLENVNLTNMCKIKEVFNRHFLFSAFLSYSRNVLYMKRQ